MWHCLDQPAKIFNCRAFLRDVLKLVRWWFKCADSKSNKNRLSQNSKQAMHSSRSQQNISTLIVKH